MIRTMKFAMAFSAMIGFFALSGCGLNSSNPPSVATTPASVAPANSDSKVAHSGVKEEEHHHQAGAHSGIIVEIGRDSFHAEAVFEKGGLLRLFMLGNDEAKVVDVELQTLTAYVKAEGAADSASCSLEPQRQPGDAENKTSLFVGQIPQELAGKKLEVTIPSIRINGDRFRFAFSSTTESPHDEAMPATDLADADERALYLTPGGIYTQADIEANGHVTASQKLKNFVPKHDLKPKMGDLICPITLTKANPECTWVVGGKTYEFCCPPCVEEFVKLAKTNPNDVKRPEDYIKK